MRSYVAPTSLNRDGAFPHGVTAPAVTPWPSPNSPRDLVPPLLHEQESLFPKSVTRNDMRRVTLDPKRATLFGESPVHVVLWPRATDLPKSDLGGREATVSLTIASVAANGLTSGISASLRAESRRRGEAARSC
jgi:hypothetical protein